MAGFTLANAEALHEASPEAFALVARAERESIAVAESAQLCFETEHYSERMWVTVTAVEDGRYRGLLTDECWQLKRGTPVEFGPEHVFMTQAAGLALAELLGYSLKAEFVRKVCLTRREAKALAAEFAKAKAPPPKRVRWEQERMRERFYDSLPFGFVPE